MSDGYHSERTSFSSTRTSFEKDPLYNDDYQVKPTRPPSCATVFQAILLLIALSIPALALSFLRHFKHAGTNALVAPSNLPVSSTAALDVSTTPSIPSIIPTTFSPTSSVLSTTSAIPSTTPPVPSPQEAYVLDPSWNFDTAPTRREYAWTIEDKDLSPDGIVRPMIVINGGFPGPLIECNEGDTLAVTVQNRAINATSIHWHGLYQNGTNWMDGTVGITQCPIAPGRNFTYEFMLQQSGTYFYHAHHSLQASDGLIGPLVIHSRDEKTLQQIPYSTDRVIMVQDHYHNTTSELLMHYLRPGGDNVEPVPDGALINGIGVRGDDTAFPKIRLDRGEAHRLRLINTGAFAEFQVQIDEHEWAVTEVDGTDVVPAYFHRLKIAPAQRYSIVVSANMSADAYWLRARMLTRCFSEENPNMEPEMRAIVTYEESASLPSSLDWPDVVEVVCRDMDSTELHPVMAMDAPEPNSLLYLRANFEIGDWRLSRGFFNQSSWRPTLSSPSLFRAVDGLSGGDENFTMANYGIPAVVNELAFDLSREMVVQTEGIQVIDLAIQNYEDSAHPFHLHGHKFFVMAEGKGQFDEEAVYSRLNATNPLRRDTATVEGYHWIILRVIADNPGMWAFHCHVSWHSEAGLLMQFLTRADVVSQWTVPDSVHELCSYEGIEKGARPNDDIWVGDFGK